MGLVAVKMALDYRYTPAKILFSAFWRVLPDAFRIKAAALLNRMQIYAALPLPSAPCEVWTSDKALRSRFKESLPVDEAVEPASYSLVITCFNEAEGIEGFLESIASQTHPATEVVVVDGGSRDGTAAKIREWHLRDSQRRGRAPFDLQLIESPGANIAHGRNIGVGVAKAAVVAFTDAGCELDRRWAEQLLRPFSAGADVALGWYRPIITTPMERAFAHYLVPRVDDIDPRTFLPSARSLAMTRATFMRTSGYPEYLTRAGEDSLFAVYLRSVATRFAFVPDALVFWRFPRGTIPICKMIFRYAVGDGEAARAFLFYYLRLLHAVGGAAIELLSGISLLLAGSVLGGSFGMCAHLGGLLLSGFGLLRYVLFLAGYRFWSGAGGAQEIVRRGMALVLFTAVQGAGFVRGALRRGEIERRRVRSAPAGIAVLFAPELPLSGDLHHPTTQRLLSLFERGYFVTLIFSSLAKGETHLEHQRLEAHLRSSFDVEKWRDKFSTYIRDGVLIEDMLEDSFSRELAERLKTQ